MAETESEKMRWDKMRDRSRLQSDVHVEEIPRDNGSLLRQEQMITALTEEIHQLSDNLDALSNRLQVIEELHIHETMFKGSQQEPESGDTNVASSNA